MNEYGSKIAYLSLTNKIVHSINTNFDKLTYSRLYNIQNCYFLYNKLETIQQNIHIGKILQEAVEKTGINIEVITKRAGYKRGTYYLHIKKKDLPISILEKYAKAIGHDFSEEIHDLPSLMVEEPEPLYGNQPATIEEAIRQRNHWKEKYYELMEKYIKCIDKK